MTSQTYAESLEIQYCLLKGDENLTRYNSPKKNEISYYFHVCLLYWKEFSDSRMFV